MISGGPGYFAGQLREVKREKLHNEFSGDLENVISEMNHAIDVPREDLKQFLSSLISRMDVYRTYISDSSGKCGESYLAKTVQDLVTEEPDLRTVGESILEELHGAKRLTALFGRFQQLSSPVMAKSLEDTMFFRYNRLISLNEVGCDPAVFGYSLPRFHEFMKSRGEAWKYSMNCTSTHDTKLGEDSRIRLSVLSEVPEEWFPVYKKWTALNARFKKEIDGKFAPDPNEEYYLYQVMLAGRYFDEDFNESFRNRISSHMIKALRESGTKTSWINGNSVYESQIELFVKKILDPEISGEFLSSFDEFLNVISKYGALKSLSQLAVKMTSPGVPDIYQGSETWNFSLTDPDNRRPVDYNELEKSLSEIERRKGDPDLASKLLSKYRDGLVKLYLTNILLIHRRNNRELFLEGSYTPLECGGDHEDNLIAFSREFRGKISITIAPRFFSGLVSSDGKIPGPESWGDTYLKIGWRASRLVDIITGRQIELGNDNRIGAGNLLNKFPVCILYGES